MRSKQVFAKKDKSEKFNYYWKIKGDFIGGLNRRGNGWSGVIISKDQNSVSDKSSGRICIKKQENYVSYSFFHFIRGTLTIENEVRNLIYCNKHGIKTPEIVYSGKSSLSGKRRAILVTSFLEKFTPLNEIIHKDQNKFLTDSRARRLLISKIALEVRKLHKIRVMHNNLYPKHIFIDPKNLDICFIDLEKSRKKIFSKWCIFRDMDVLNRHTQPFSKSDKLRFFKAYYGTEVLTPEMRKRWKQLAEKQHKDIKKKEESNV